MRRLPVMVVSGTLGLALILACFNSCDSRQTFSTVHNTSIVGNPMSTPTANKLITAACGVIHRCQPSVALVQCEAGLLATAGFETPLGLSSSYADLAAIASAEANGALVGNPSLGTSCQAAITNLNCSDPDVLAAYEAAAPNPFSEAPKMVPAGSCDQVYVPGIGLEVPIELLDYGLASAATAHLFERTRTSFNAADYNGTVTYSFEVVATNSDTSVHNISLVDASGATLAAVPVAAGLSNPTRLRTQFTPNAGADNFRIQIDGTISAGQLNVFTGRVLVRQVDATRTRIFVPFSGLYPDSASNADDSTAAVDYGTGAIYDQARDHHQSLWRKNNAAFSEIAGGLPWTFEAVLSNGASGSTAFASLFDATTNNQVSNSEISTPALTPTLVTVDFADAAAGFANLDEFEIRINQTGSTAYLYRAGLWLRLTNLAHGEVYYRYARTTYHKSSSAYLPPWTITLLDPALFSGLLGVFNEATGYVSAAGTVCTTDLFDVGTSDSSISGLAVSGSALTFNSAVKSRYRSPAVSINPGHLFISRTLANPGPGDCIVPQSRAVIQF